MNATGQTREQVVQASLVYAIGLLNGDTSPEVVQAKLVERGLTEEEAVGVVSNLLTQAVYTDAVDMLNRGLSPNQVKQQLATKGLAPQSASGVVEDILEQNRRPQEGAESVTGVLLKLVGGVVFLAGIGLLIGNITGAFPTFPFAGYLTMGLGGLIWGASNAR